MGNRLDKIAGTRFFCTSCHVPQADAKPLVLKRGQIEFDNISFAYDANNPVLKGVSLRVASSAVDITQDPDWRKYRAFWQERFGQPGGTLGAATFGAITAAR